MEYTVYTDESYITAERYRSICALSMPISYSSLIEEDLLNILKSSEVEEFKWNKLSNAKNKFCAMKLINYLLDNIHTRNIRIDVLIWDTQDSRHDIKNRDDNANFERMFFHLLKTSMKKREYGSDWHIYPDEKMGVDWETIQQCLSSVGKRRDYSETLFGPFFSDSYYNVSRFLEIESQKAICCQIADLFSGLAVFSKNSYKRFSLWRENKSATLLLLELDKEELSNSEKYRFEVLHDFNKKSVSSHRM